MGGLGEEEEEKKKVLKDTEKKARGTSDGLEQLFFAYGVTQPLGQREPRYGTHVYALPIFVRVLLERSLSRSILKPSGTNFWENTGGKGSCTRPVCGGEDCGPLLSVSLTLSRLAAPSWRNQR